MHEFTTPKKTKKEEKYESIILQIKHLIKDENDIIGILSNIAAAIHQTFEWLWVGFYIVKKNQLILGPFQGPVACFRIEKGKGVCGMTWKMNKTIIVPNVEKFPGHIACSSDSKSEIVLPIKKNNKTFGVLDIDSIELNSFDKTDQKYLEKIVNIIEKKLG